MKQKWRIIFLNLLMRGRRFHQMVAWVALWISDGHKFLKANAVVNPANFISFFLQLMSSPRVWFFDNPDVFFPWWCSIITFTFLLPPYDFKVTPFASGFPELSVLIFFQNCDLDWMFERLNWDHFILIKIRANKRPIGGHFDKGNVHHDAMEFFVHVAANQTTLRIKWHPRLFSQTVLLLSCTKAPSNVSGDDTNRHCWPDMESILLKGIEIRLRSVLIAAIGRQFWPSSAHALTQTNISGLSVLNTFTSRPRIFLCRKYLFLWSSQFCFRNWFSVVNVHLFHWLACQLLRKVRRVFQKGFLLLLIEGIARSSRLLHSLYVHSRTSSLSVVSFALSTTARCLFVRN